MNDQIATAPSGGDVRGRSVLIVGHGIAGAGLAADLRRRGATVVGFLDDEVIAPEVLGPLTDVNRVVAEQQVDLLCIAIPSLDSGRLREFIELIEVGSLEVDIVPRTYRTLAHESVSVDDLTDIDVLDLIGRKPVKHDVLASAAFLKGKTVMVTGAAGSIGSQLMRQIVAMDVDAVVGVDWWENGLFFLGQEMDSNPVAALRVADVKNERRLRSIFEEFRPSVVFHAAAYKHVPLMQANPVEAITNNVLGTRNVFRLASEFDVADVVYVSTDKAVNPVNVMGATKRLGELMMSVFAAESPQTRFHAVRFGNVIQSNGSVMQVFRSQISSRQPLTVTDPDVTRFFMTVDEAAQLIIQAALLGRSGGIYVLDMGEPVRIMDLAKSLVKVVDPTLQIVVTGLRPGEKMYEELTYDPEGVAPTTNPKIFETSDSDLVNTDRLLDRVDELIDAAVVSELSVDDAIGRLRDFGFELS